MRADRLLSMLMILQVRGQVTASRLAQELEVSERTIYRDIDALSAAGVPVYAERGVGGGISLLDSYRTTLTGLTDKELRALFMLSIPAPLVELGVNEELRAALLKLAASLPAGRRHEEERVRQRFHLDSVWWFQSGEPVPHLNTLQEGVWHDRRIVLTYNLPFQTRVERLVDPYGLVAKGGVWYLIFCRQDHLRAMRVSRVLAARLSEERFERPAGFDLARFWGEWCAAYEENQPSFLVVARVAPDLVPLLPLYFGPEIKAKIAEAGPADSEGWITVTLPFETLEAARERVLGLGRAIEVLAPEALRCSVIDFATQIVDFYTQRKGQGRGESFAAGEPRTN
jgi:predicted DNA-binding transcriptional regulator YafY